MRDQKESMKKLYAQRREKNLCLWCGKPLDRDGVLCSECTSKNRQHSKERRDYLLRIGICPICGKRKITEGYKSCLICRESSAMRMKQQKSEQQKEKKSQYQKELRKERAKQGLCTSCGINKPEPGFKTCPECRRRKRNYRHMYVSKYQLSDRALWVSQGKCERCGSDDLQEGTKLCKEHYKQACEALAKGREVCFSNRAKARAEQEAAELRKSHELMIQFKPRTIYERKQQKAEKDGNKE